MEDDIVQVRLDWRKATHSIEQKKGLTVLIKMGSVEEFFKSLVVLKFQIRLMLKVHAFVRETAPKVLSFQKNCKGRRQV